MTTHREHLPRTPHPMITPERIGALSWGLFFIWVGIAVAANLGLGLALVGIGAITLATQLVRWAIHAPVETFWLVAGGFFIAAGVWPLLGLTVSFVPILLMAMGVLIAAGGLGKKHDRTGRVL